MDIETITQVVAEELDQVLDSINHGVLSVDWNDLGEITIVVRAARHESETKTFRFVCQDITDEDL